MKNRKEKLPNRKDFGYGLDEDYAWKHFGNLTIKQAYRKFCEHPDYYQEDFMFMDYKAFEYYIPILEMYLRQVIPEDESDDCQAWILGCAFESQLECFHKKFSEKTITRISRICIIVKNRFNGLELDEPTKKRILKQWAKVEVQLK